MAAAAAAAGDSQVLRLDAPDVLYTCLHEHLLVAPAAARHYLLAMTQDAAELPAACVM